MGCGASKSGATGTLEDVEQQRDPEDYLLDPIVLHVTKIEEFDEVFTHLSSLLNRLIELNNNVHLAVGAVKAAYAPITGGFQLVVSLAPATDIVLLDIHASRNNPARPSPESMQRLMGDPAVREAATELEAARTALHDYLASCATHLALKPARDGGSLSVDDAPSEPPPAQLQRLNAAMARLQGLLGSAGHVSASVKPTTAFGTTTIRAGLYKRKPGGTAPAPVPATPDGSADGAAAPPPPPPELQLEPVSVMDVCSSAQAVRIKQAEAFLVDRTQHLAHRIKGLELQWEVVSGYFVVLGTEIPNEDVQQQVAKLLQAVNIALFKLLNAGSAAIVPSSLTNAVVEVVRPVFSSLKERHGSSSQRNYSLKTLVSVVPTVLFAKQGDGVPPSFDFHFNVQLQDHADIPEFPDCLTELASVLLAAMEHLVAHILGALQELPAISEDVDVLLEQAKEFYELCPEAAARRGLSMMEAVKCSKATGSNLRMLYNTQELFLAFGENVKRIADELGESAAAVAKVMDKMLADDSQ